MIKEIRSLILTNIIKLTNFAFDLFLLAVEAESVTVVEFILFPAW